MSYNSSVTNTYASEGQSALGRQQAQSGGPCSGQQAGESHISFETRQSEYNWTRSQQDKKSS